MDNIKVGNFLQSLRKEKNITQSELAQVLGISNKTVSKWECGDALPELPLLKALAENYNVTVDEILSGERNNLEKQVEENKKSFTNTMSVIISLFVTIFLFLIGVSIGYILKKGIVFACVGLVGSILGIFSYFFLSYIFDKNYYLNIKKYKYQILLVVSSILFILILSVALLCVSNNDSIISFKLFLGYIIRIIAIYGYLILIALLLLSDKKNKIDFIIKLLFLSLMLTINVYLECASSFEIKVDYYYERYYKENDMVYSSTRDTDEVISNLRLYELLFKTSSNGYMLVPLLINISIIVLLFISIIKKYNIIVPISLAIIIMIFNFNIKLDSEAFYEYFAKKHFLNNHHDYLNYYFVFDKSYGYDYWSDTGHDVVTLSAIIPFSILLLISIVKYVLDIILKIKRKNINSIE